MFTKHQGVLAAAVALLLVTTLGAGCTNIIPKTPYAAIQGVWVSEKPAENGIAAKQTLTIDNGTLKYVLAMNVSTDALKVPDGASAAEIQNYDQLKKIYAQMNGDLVSATASYTVKTFTATDYTLALSNPKAEVLKTITADDKTLEKSMNDSNGKIKDMLQTSLTGHTLVITVSGANTITVKDPSGKGPFDETFTRATK